MPSDGAGGRSGGDGDRGSGGSTGGGERGGGGSRGGFGGVADSVSGGFGLGGRAGEVARGAMGGIGGEFGGGSRGSSGGGSNGRSGGYGVGATGMNSINDARTSMGLGPAQSVEQAQKSLSDAQEKAKQDAIASKTIKTIARGLGLGLGGPFGLGAAAMTVAEKYGRHDSELSDMEKAAQANGMGDTNNTDSYITEALAGNLNANDPAQKALLDSVKPPTTSTQQEQPPASKVAPTMTREELKKYARS